MQCTIATINNNNHYDLNDLPSKHHHLYLWQRKDATYDVAHFPLQKGDSLV